MQASRPGGPDATPTEALLDALGHAVLALAAATVLAHFGDMPAAGSDAWLAAVTGREAATP